MLQGDADLDRNRNTFDAFIEYVCNKYKANITSTKKKEIKRSRRWKTVKYVAYIIKEHRNVDVA